MSDSSHFLEPGCMSGGGVRLAFLLSLQAQVQEPAVAPGQLQHSMQGDITA